MIPEDRANEELANGFVGHHHVLTGRIQVMRPAGGWSQVLKKFREEYISKLRNNSKTHVVMLIDFDGDFDNRRAEFENEIPPDIKTRVFVLGSKYNPEMLKKALNQSREKIGSALANDCDANTSELWGHEQLSHNEPDRLRLLQCVKPFLF